MNETSYSEFKEKLQDFSEVFNNFTEEQIESVIGIHEFTEIQPLPPAKIKQFFDVDLKDSETQNINTDPLELKD